MEAGYSGTPLRQKLGIKAGHRVSLVDAPAGFEAALAPLPEGAALSGPGGTADMRVAFFTSRAEWEERFASLTAGLPPEGAVWVAWPKRAARVATDMTEQAVRDVALPAGWVDVKVCAIDATWSGLKLVLRKELRA